MESLADPLVWISLVTLTVLEIVLGIDNIIFISILAGKLPLEKQSRARRWGLAMAMITRLMLLASLAYVVKLTAPWFTTLGQEISGRDLVLILGGLFLLYKSTREIHERLEEEREKAVGAANGGAGVITGRKRPSFTSIILQIMVLDIIFSLDSVITAVGMADHLWVMMTAVIIAVIIMLIAVDPIAIFINNHPTVKMLALSFLLLVGTALVAEGFDMHVPKGYIYFAMGFSVMVEVLNIRISRTGKSGPGGDGTSA